jgi:hypothetical protein
VCERSRSHLLTVVLTFISFSNRTILPRLHLSTRRRTHPMPCRSQHGNHGDNSRHMVWSSPRPILQFCLLALHPSYCVETVSKSSPSCDTASMERRIGDFMLNVSSELCREDSSGFFYICGGSGKGKMSFCSNVGVPDLTTTMSSSNNATCRQPLCRHVLRMLVVL